MGDDISNVGEGGQWVIFVLYDEKMKSLRKILLLKLYYDEFLVDGIYLQDYMEIKDWLLITVSSHTSNQLLCKFLGGVGFFFSLFPDFSPKNRG